MTRDTPDLSEKASIALLIVASERRAYLNLLVLSLRVKKLRAIDHVLVVDTSTVSRPWRGRFLLQSLRGRYELIEMPGVSLHRVLRSAWSHLANEVGVTHVLMFEEDFVLLRKLPIGRLVHLANDEKTLQVVFPRQRWFEPEYDYRDRRTYLRARHAYRETPDGDRLIGYFTNNPHCMRLERILALLSDVAPSDDYTWESEYALASAVRRLESLQLTSSRPWVWHVGAATAAGVRAAAKAGTLSWPVYVRAHAGRMIVVARRQIESRRRGRRESNSS